MAGGVLDEAILAVTVQKPARGGRRAPLTELGRALAQILREGALDAILATGVWQFARGEGHMAQHNRPSTPSPIGAL